MNYEEMSDGAINLEVHYLVNDIPKHHAVIMTKDYCNNPSDAWSIILESRISLLIPDDGTLSSEAVVIERHIGYDDDEIHCSINYSTQNDNPLRAAMICFLKMKDAENG